MPPPNIDAETQTSRQNSDKEIEEWRAARSDLAAQWETADITNLAFRAGILGIILVAWTLAETRNASREANAATRAAESALAETKEANRAQLRAYLSIQGVNFGSPVIRGERLRVSVEFKNTGQTPANDTKIIAQLMVGDCGLMMAGQPELVEEKERTLGGLGPGDTRRSGVSVEVGGAAQWEGITAKIKAGDSAIILAGALTYTDAFGETRHTNFAAEWIGKTPRPSKSLNINQGDNNIN